LDTAGATRILIVIPNLEIGGAERQMTLLLSGLDRGRYAPALVCCSLRGPLLAEVPEHVQVYDLGKRSRWDFPFLVLRLRRILEAFRPEFIIASMEYAALLTWISNRLCSQRAHIIARKEVMPSQARLGESFRRPKRFLDQLVDRRVDMIVAPSRGILQELKECLGVPVPMAMIPNVVDTRRVVPKSERMEADSPCTMVAMGRFVSWKRFDLLVRAIAQLPAGAFRLDLIGDGPERESLEQLAAQLGMTETVRFHGYHADPFPLLKNASFGVLPSQFEPFGNVIIEMFAAGLPVVAFDVDYGPREIIRHGENGLLVPQRDAAQLAAALRTLIHDPVLRKRLGENARRDAEARYALPAAIGRYEECFAALRGSGNLLHAAAR
jgi:glycosyltransferase involved in cell wall biosynthesis